MSVTKTESKKDRYPIETCVTMTPTEPEPREEDSGNPGDLFACAENGKFFTVINMEIDSIPRNAGSRSFMCPVCTTSLTFKPSHKRLLGEPLARCGTCSWDTSQREIQDMGDLLHRVKVPYPWLESHFRALKANRGIGRTNSHTKIIERLAVTPRMVGSERPLGDGVAFAELQDAHEKKVFEGFLPPRHIPAITGGPKNDIQMMCADIDSKELIDGKERRAVGVWFKSQLGPQQRVRSPHVVVKSPFTKSVVVPKWNSAVYEGGDMEYTGAYILPKVMINIKAWEHCHNGCGAHGNETDILISFRNERQLTANINLVNWVERSQSLDCKIGAGEQIVTKMKGVKWTARSVEHVGWLNGLCDHVLQLELQVRYDMRRGSPSSAQSTMSKWQRLCRNTWRICLFVRHKFASKSDE